MNIEYLAIKRPRSHGCDGAPTLATLEGTE
jgi:hypothetical protein